MTFIMYLLYIIHYSYFHIGVWVSGKLRVFYKMTKLIGGRFWVQMASLTPRFRLCAPCHSLSLYCGLIKNKQEVTQFNFPQPQIRWKIWGFKKALKSHHLHEVWRKKGPGFKKKNYVEVIDPSEYSLPILIRRKWIYFSGDDTVWIPFCAIAFVT